MIPQAWKGTATHQKRHTTALQCRVRGGGGGGGGLYFLVFFDGVLNRVSSCYAYISNIFRNVMIIVMTIIPITASLDMSTRVSHDLRVGRETHFRGNVPTQACITSNYYHLPMCKNCTPLGPLTFWLLPLSFAHDDKRRLQRLINTAMDGPV